MKEQANFKQTRGKAVLVFSLLLSTAGCNQLLDVDAPGEILASTLEDPAYASLLASSAVSSFECAFGAYILTAGALGDELIISGTSSSEYPMDQRTLTDRAPYGASATGTTPNNCVPYRLYVPLSIARYQADDLVKKLQGEWKDQKYTDRAEMMGTLSAVSGYSLLLIGESMCSATIDLGKEMFPKDFFAEAKKRFDVALTSGASAQTINWARVGMGRTLLDLGDAKAAAAAVTSVPVGFVWNATYSNAVASRRNPVFYNISTSRNPVVDGRYYYGVTWDGVADKRVPVTNPGTLKASDNLVPRWEQTKYPAVNSPLPVARWAEAQLIIAEAEGGQTAVNIINDLHTRAGIPPFNPAVHKPTGPFGTDVIRNQVVEERRRELFLESHHLGDVRRYGLALHPAAGQVYPWTGGGFYGNVTCFPAPFSETGSNPNF